MMFLPSLLNSESICRSVDATGASYLRLEV